MKQDEIRLIDFRTSDIKRLLKGHEDVVNGLAFSPDGRKLISGSADKTARIWDVATGRALHTLTGHTDSIYAVAFSPDGQRAVTGSDDHTLRLWDVGTGREESVLTGHEDKVKSVAFTPDPGREGGRRFVENVARGVVRRKGFWGCGGLRISVE